MDQDLQEIRRSVALAAHDGASWLALGRKLARTGERADAIAALHRGVALGGDPLVARDALVALRAPASPWSHPLGDAGRTSRATVRGPRRGEVVLDGEVPREGMAHPQVQEVVIAWNGEVLIGGTHGKIVRLDGSTLEPIAPVRVAPEAARVHLAAGHGFTLASTRDELALVRDGRTRALHAAPVRGAIVNIATVDGQGLLVVTTPVFGQSVHERRIQLRSSADLSLLATLGSVHALASEARTIACADDRAYVPAANERPRLSGFDVARRVPLESVPLGEARSRATDAIALESGEVRAIVNRALGNPELVTVDRDGHELARRELPPLPGRWFGQVLGASGSSVVVMEAGVFVVAEGVRRLEQVASVTSMALADREGVLYVPVLRDDGTRAIVALGPDGERLFEVVGRYRPVAIDGRGRLLALEESHPPRVVAIE